MREAFVYKIALWDNAAYNITPSRFQGAVQTNPHYHHMLQPENQNKYTRLNILNNKITNNILQAFDVSFPHVQIKIDKYCHLNYLVSMLHREVSCVRNEKNKKKQYDIEKVFLTTSVM